MKDLFATAWDYLQRVPPAAWGALVVGMAFLILILRGRRVEAELARAKLREQIAKSKLVAAENWRDKAVHEKAADIAAAEARELEAAAEEIRAVGKDELARIKSLPTHEVHREYIEIAKQAKKKAHETK